MESYGTDLLQKVKVFNFGENNTKNVVFIHGGAWRDPNMTYNDFEIFASYIFEKSKGKTNVFSINYRLSPAVKHPLHLNDVNDALEHLNDKFGVKSASLIGHSVGATLILQTIARDACKITFENCYLVDGIYDIPEMLIEYPDYTFFVDEAHNSEQDWTNATNIYNDLKNFQKLVIIQSTQDELLSELQTDILGKKLLNMNYNFIVHKGKWGLHEEVIRRNEVFELVTSSI